MHHNKKATIGDLTISVYGTCARKVHYPHSRVGLEGLDWNLLHCRGMISREGFRKISVGVWIAVSLPFVILGFKAGLLVGVLALGIGIAGIFSHRAFRPRRH